MMINEEDYKIYIILLECTRNDPLSNVRRKFFTPVFHDIFNLNIKRIKYYCTMLTFYENIPKESIIHPKTVQLSVFNNWNVFRFSSKSAALHLKFGELYVAVCGSGNTGIKIRSISYNRAEERIRRHYLDINGNINWNFSCQK